MTALDIHQSSWTQRTPAFSEGYMGREELFRAILVEMERVWGEPGFGGNLEEYDWLRENYGISENDDLRWQDISAQYANDLPTLIADLTEEERNEVMDFLEDDTQVIAFLKRLLENYQSSDATYFT